jgi:hypothetical protein
MQAHLLAGQDVNSRFPIQWNLDAIDALTAVREQDVEKVKVRRLAFGCTDVPTRA